MARYEITTEDGTYEIETEDAPLSVAEGGEDPLIAAIPADEKMKRLRDLEIKKMTIDNELDKSDQYTNPVVAGAGQLVKNASELAGTVGGGALGMIAGSPVPVVGQAIGTAAGSVAGASGGRIKGDEWATSMGLQPDMSILKDDKSLTGKISDDLDNIESDALWEVLPLGIGTAAKSTKGIYRAIFPNMNLAKYKKAMMDGITSTFLGAPKGTAARETQLVKEVADLEKTFLEANPMRGINPEDPNAVKQLITNMNEVKKNAKAEKDALIIVADGKLGDKPLKVDLSGAEFKEKGTKQIVEGKLKETVPWDYETHGKDAKTFIKNNASHTEVDKSIKGADLHSIVQELDQEIKALGGYDDLRLAAQSTDPSFFAKHQELQGLREARSFLSSKLNEHIGPRAKDLNKTIQAMIEYGKATRRFSVQLLEDYAVKSGKSLNKNIGASSQGAFDAVTGGLVDTLNSNRQMAKNLTTQADSIKGLQEVASLRANGPQPGAFDTTMNAASSLIDTTAGQAATALLPRAIEGWQGLSLPEAQANELMMRDPNTFQQAQQAFASGSPDEARRGVAMMASIAPEMFEPPSAPGLASMVDGVIHDDLEKQYATQKVTEAFKGDTAKRLRAKEAILTNKPLEPYVIEALGGNPNREKTPEDLFLEEVEGGQILEGYSLNEGEFKNSGVTVATGVDLGNRSVEELRQLGISEDLVIKLSPHIGKKGDRAKQSLKNYPLNLTQEEADLLDQKIKGQVKKAIAGNYKNSTGVDLEGLPEEARTVINSLAYNFGANLEGKLPTAWKHIVKGDWLGLQKFLQTTKWKQPKLKDRRMKEAMLLEPLIPRLPGESDFNISDSQFVKMAQDDESVV